VHYEQELELTQLTQLGIAEEHKEHNLLAGFVAFGKVP